MPESALFDTLSTIMPEKKEREPDPSIRLPIDEFKEIIEQTIARNPVTILTAETGAGKSTRLPLWLWKKQKKVMVTQPRRIAARSLSYYLSHITGTAWGQAVGYQTGFDRKYSRATTLLYLTDGVQMVKEIKGERSYDVLILDEVHEWNLNQEVLIGLVRKNLDRGFYRKSDKKVVVMSATLQAQQLSAFLHNAPVITVPGRGYPVTMHHNAPEFLLSDTVQMVEMERNVLVFQPGKGEIDTFIETLKETLEHDKLKAKVLPLHSELSIRDQAMVFKHYPVPKVVVATDIAQTSLTIDDIDAVIDSGIKKEVHHIKGIEGLYPVDISHSECLQRAGRAGRVKSGQYILCAEAAMTDRVPYPEPELRRLNLESAVLRLINWGISPVDFPYFHAPKKNLIYKAIQQLKVFGAITEEGAITPDGKRMAELPVSIRSSRLLLEARKGSPAILDSALKLIAILETKGILNKAYQGERLEPVPHHSDLLNQLFMWNDARAHKKIISYKKLSMAKEIYRELKTRLNLDKNGGPLKAREVSLLLRALLSTFIDHFYTRVGNVYVRDEEERQLDRTSSLFESMPDMVVGIPFDLVVKRDNPHTGETEKILLPLLTFTTEVSLKLLEELKPFSYRRESEVQIENNLLTILDKIFFGGNMVTTLKRPPRWSDRNEREVILEPVVEWYENRKNRYRLEGDLGALENYFPELGEILSIPPDSFSKYRRRFLLDYIRRNLKMDDLDLFFKLQRGPGHISLKQLLPPPLIRKLKEAHWPGEIRAGDRVIQIHYTQKHGPYIKPDPESFELLTAESTCLPTGEQPEIILDGRRFAEWDYAVYYFNRCKKERVFEQKWKELKKPARMEDLAEVPFPQTFIGGQGMEKAQFEFYAAPLLEDDEVYLVHFFEKETAQAHFDSMKEQWQAAVERHKRRKLEDIFRQKGWKVK